MKSSARPGVLQKKITPENDPTMVNKWSGHLTRTRSADRAQNSTEPLLYSINLDIQFMTSRNLIVLHIFEIWKKSYDYKNLEETNDDSVLLENKFIFYSFCE